jgi:hypothetical protein
VLHCIDTIIIIAHLEMGGAESSNTVSDTVESDMNIMQSVTNTCWSTVTVSNQVIITGSQNVTVDEINQGIYQSVDMECVTNATFSSDVSNSIDSQIKQQAESISKGYGFSEADASNCLDLCYQLFTTVQQSYVSSMQTMTSGANVVYVNDSTNVDIGVVNQQITMEEVFKNVSNVAMDSNAANSLQQIIDQYSSAVKKAGLGMLIIAIAILAILALLALGMLSGFIMNSGFWFLICTIGALTSAYFVLAYFTGWWPYHDKDERESSDDTMFYISLGCLGVFSLIDIILILYTISKGKSNKTKVEIGGVPTGTTGSNPQQTTQMMQMMFLKNLMSSQQPLPPQPAVTSTPISITVPTPTPTVTPTPTPTSPSPSSTVSSLLTGATSLINAATPLATQAMTALTASTSEI